MIKKSILLAVMTALSFHAQADVGAMIGVGYTFGGSGPSFTIKALSSDHRDETVAAAGISFYPLSQNKFGLDLGIGYHFDNSAAVLSWDFLQESVQLSGGWANTKNSSTATPPPPPPQPPPV